MQHACRVGNNVLIGANASNLRRYWNRNNAVLLAAGSVVTKDVGPGTVVAELPAKVIKTRDSSRGKK